MSISEKRSLVLDIGESNIRMGFSGDSKPSIFLNSIFAVRRSSQAQNISENFNIYNETLEFTKKSQGKKLFVFGDELQTDMPYYQYKRIFDIKGKNERLTHYEVYSDMYAYELCPGMSLDPKNYPLVVIEPSKDDEKFRKCITAMILQSGVPKVFLVKKAAADLYACGRCSGTVIHSGGQRTKVTPVEDGYVHQNCHSYSNFGGDRITKKISKQLDHVDKYMPENLNLSGEVEDYDPTFFEYFQFLRSEDIKKKLVSLKENEE